MKLKDATSGLRGLQGSASLMEAEGGVLSSDVTKEHGTSFSALLMGEEGGATLRAATRVRRENT